MDARASRQWPRRNRGRQGQRAQTARRHRRGGTRRHGRNPARHLRADRGNRHLSHSPAARARHPRAAMEIYDRSTSLVRYTHSGEARSRGPTASPSPPKTAPAFPLPPPFPSASSISPPCSSCPAGSSSTTPRSAPPPRSSFHPGKSRRRHRRWRHFHQRTLAHHRRSPLPASAPAKAPISPSPSSPRAPAASRPGFATAPTPPSGLNCAAPGLPPFSADLENLSLDPASRAGVIVLRNQTAEPITLDRERRCPPHFRENHHAGRRARRPNSKSPRPRNTRRKISRAILTIEGLAHSGKSGGERAGRARRNCKRLARTVEL